MSYFIAIKLTISVNAHLLQMECKNKVNCVKIVSGSEIIAQYEV